jgi:hypothetical protein
LQDIRKRAGCGRDCGIFEQPRSQRYHVPEPAVEGLETIASVISVSEDLVFNCLGKLNVFVVVVAQRSYSLHFSYP